MNPSDVPAEDYGLYYNNTYMLHVSLGIVMVRANSGQLACRKNSSAYWKECLPETLQCVWPRGRAVNVGGHATFIGRRARREARRSATRGHFTVLWPGPMVGDISDAQMRELCFPSEYPSMEFVLAAFKQGERASIAITSEIILQNVGKRVCVIFRGEQSGTLKEEQGEYTYTPELDSPLTKRVLLRLRKGGLICR